MPASGLAQNSRRKVYAVLAGYFAWLHDQGAIPANPMRGIKRPTAPEPEPTYWTPDEVRRMLAARCRRATEWCWNYSPGQGRG
ncbi:MAG: hypothetical protein ACRDLL_12345 [Solirubrobacterales bacterium]